MRNLLLIILSFIMASSAFGQKSDSAQKAPGNILEAKYNKAIQIADEYFKNKDFANAKTYYQNALKLKEDEKYPKDKILECDKLKADLLKKKADSLYKEASKKSDQTKQDSTKANKFSFIGKWLGKIEGDEVILIFNADGIFRGKKGKDESDELVGIWKTMGDTLYIEGDEINKNQDPHYKSKPEKIYFTYKVQNNNEVLLYLIEEKEEFLFKRIQQ